MDDVALLLREHGDFLLIALHHRVEFTHRAAADVIVD